MSTKLEATQSAAPLKENRRSEPRFEIKMNILYRANLNDSYHQAVLVNLSQSGALITASEELETKIPLDLLIVPDDPSQGYAIQLHAIILRCEKDESAGAFNYGCYFMKINDPN